MCTAVTYAPHGPYFGRTLDSAVSYPAEVVVTPRGFSAPKMPAFGASVIGAAVVRDGCPLYFDGMNEHGLCMAGLNFTQSCRFFPARAGRHNLAQYMLIPHILGTCKSTAEAAEELSRVNLTNEAFSPDMPPARLHWMVADGNGAIVAECTSRGMRIHEDVAGVLSNEPPFEFHMHALSNHMALTAGEPQNGFGESLNLVPCGAGVGARGLPGDFSPPSRFVRAAFLRANAPAGLRGEEAVSLMFSVLGGVSVPRGACRTAEGEFYTRYTCCMDAESLVYYISTDMCRSLTAVKLRGDESGLVRYCVRRKECVLKLNF